MDSAKLKTDEARIGWKELTGYWAPVVLQDAILAELREIKELLKATNDRP